MTLNDLTVNFSHLERRSLLSDWGWLLGPDKLPVLLAASGDAFVQDVSDGSVHILDICAGKLNRGAESFERFQSLLKEKNFVVNYFAVKMVSELRASGCTLEAGQIYSFKRPPVLGGDYVLANIEPTDIEVHFSMAGQIHRQIAARPPGTSITGLSIK